MGIGLSSSERQESGELGVELPSPAWVTYVRSHAEITRQMDVALRAEHGLTLHEYEVLLQLWLEPRRRLRRVDLAGRLLITQGGVTRLLAGLEERGLVQRVPCPMDGRVVYAELTVEGAELAEQSRRGHLEEVRRLFSDRFSSAELDTLSSLLGRLTSASF